ncbi:MAG: GNAT family N-acetyltransferase [Bdellovibrionales bacterium]
MTESDLFGVQALSDQLGYPLEIEDLKSSYHRISKDPYYALFVAKDDHRKVLGWIQVRLDSKTLIHETYAEVAALVVDENHRGQGIGKLLLQEVEKWAQQKQVKTIRLLSNTKRTEAHRFYLREGYEILKTSNIFKKVF